MAKLHSFYTMNANSELNYITQEMSEEQFINALHDYGDGLFSGEGIFDFEDDDNNSDDGDDNMQDNNANNPNLEIENSFYLSDFNESYEKESFSRQLEDIEDHGDPDYNIDDIIRDSGI